MVDTIIGHNATNHSSDKPQTAKLRNDKDGDRLKTW